MVKKNWPGKQNRIQDQNQAAQSNSGRRLFRLGVHAVLRTLKWVVIAIVCGIVCGIIGSVFVKCLQAVTSLRLAHPEFLLLLPVGGVLIFLYYHLLRRDGSTGTNLILTSIRSGEEIPIRMVVAIFFSTIFSHLCGASVGREGAALQLGGSIGHALSRIFRMDKRNGHIMVKSGMAAAFSAVFGTPVTAVFFALEVTNVGMMNYNALVPCAIASFVARTVASNWFGIPHAFYTIKSIPAANPVNLFKISLLSVCCGLVSILFCIVLRQTEKLSRKSFENRFERALVMGSVLFLLSWLTGGRAYNGTNVETIQAVVSGAASGTAGPALGAGLASEGALSAGIDLAAGVTWYTWIMKIVFTALSLAAGYKGGEIVPTFFIGATFGYYFGGVIHFESSLCAAVGMGAVFCGVTNAPVTSIFMCIELFGVEGLPYYVLAIAVAYIASSYYGLYPAQKIVFSKYQSDTINKDTD